MEDIGFIIINFNTSEYTVNCVKSIIKHTSPKIKYKIIIIDNNSRNGDYLNLRKLEDIDNIVLFRNKINIGFAGANMLGIQFCNPKYYYFLNNDTLLLNDCASILLRFLERNVKVGICSGQMYDENQSLGINFNYFPDLKLKLIGSNILRLFSPADYPKKGLHYKNPLRVQVLNGSSLFTRANIFNDIGGFDTSLFLYCEEEDICLRMKKAGYSCYLLSEARYIHFTSKSSSLDQGINFDMLKEFFISQHILYKKHYGRFSSYIWRLTQFFRSFRKLFADRRYINLAFFILFGPDSKYSLRYKQ